MPLLRPLTHYTLVYVRCIIFQVSPRTKQFLVLFRCFLPVHNVNCVQTLLESCELAPVMLPIVFQSIIFHLEWNSKQCLFFVRVGGESRNVEGCIESFRLFEFFVEFFLEDDVVGLMIQGLFGVLFNPFVNIGETQLHRIVDQWFIKSAIFEGVSFKIKSELLLLVFAFENFPFLPQDLQPFQLFLFLLFDSLVLCVFHVADFDVFRILLLFLLPH